jgi:hypothetical protein
VSLQGAPFPWHIEGAIKDGVLMMSLKVRGTRGLDRHSQWNDYKKAKTWQQVYFVMLFRRQSQIMEISASQDLRHS